MATSAGPRTVQQNISCLEKLRGLLNPKPGPSSVLDAGVRQAQVPTGEEVHPQSSRVEQFQHFHRIFKIITLAVICVLKVLDTNLTNLAIAAEENSPL